MRLFFLASETMLSVSCIKGLNCASFSNEVSVLLLINAFISGDDYVHFPNSPKPKHNK